MFCLTSTVSGPHRTRTRWWPCKASLKPSERRREGSGDGRGEEEEGMTFDDYLDALTDECGEPAAADAPAGKA